MKQSVSTRSILPIASVLSMSILWVVFVLPAMGAVSGGLLGLFTLGAALWMGMRSAPLVAQAMRNAEPVRAIVPAKPVL